jgi:hypothetical protein
VNVLPAIVSVALRDPPLFALTENDTVPLPVPFAPPVIEIHDASIVAVHAQFGPVVTVTVPLPPSALKDWLVGAMVKLHDGAGCVIVAVLVPIWIVADRDPLLLAAAVNVTVPLPCPLLPPVMVIHGAEAVAVQLQPLAEATAIEPLPPDAAIVCVAGSSVKLHEAGLGAGDGFGFGFGAGAGAGAGTSDPSAGCVTVSV